MLMRKVWRNRSYLGQIWRDLRDTRQATRFLREDSAAEKGATFNLYPLDDESIYSLKQMGFVAQALRLRGWKVQVLFRNRSMILGRLYFKAFGIKRFVYLDDYPLSRKEKIYCRKKVEEFLAMPLSLQNVKSWSFENCWIGPQIVATLSRIRFEGTIDFQRPEVRRELSRMLGPILEHVLQAIKCLSYNRADLALTIEANYAQFGPLVDAAIAQGISVIQMIQPWKDDALTFRRMTSASRREHPSSVSQETLTALMKRPWTDREEQALNKIFQDRYNGRWFLQNRNQSSTRPYSRDELIRRFTLNPAKPIAVVFSQVLWDANLFYGKDLFEDAGEWFLETVKAACRNSELNWLIKLHPANVWKRNYEDVTNDYAELVMVREEIGELPSHVKIIPADDDISTHSLFETIDYGVTVRGTAGLELVCFGKNCVTAGTGRYSNLGFTLDSEDREEYLSRLAKLHNESKMSDDQILRAKWHAYAAFVLRTWPMISAQAEFRYLERGRAPLV